MASRLDSRYSSAVGGIPGNFRGVVQREPIVSVIGPGEAVQFMESMAFDVGRGLAELGITLVCGGGSGVMEAACRGAREYGGRTIGILPGADAEEANPYVDIAIPTGLGEARNPLVVSSGQLVIAIGEGYGTLSEVAYALRLRKHVIGLGTWAIPGIDEAVSPSDALEKASAALGLSI